MVTELKVVVLLERSVQGPLGLPFLLLRKSHALRDHHWAGFARGYNGVSFAKNHHDEKLRCEYADLVANGFPIFDCELTPTNLAWRPCARDEATSGGPLPRLLRLRFQRAWGRDGGLRRLSL